MPAINKESLLSKTLAQNHILIPIINRFGVHLGVGDKTIDTICKEHNLDVNFLLVVLNTYLDKKYCCENDVNDFELEQVATYFQQTNHSYLHHLVPNVEKHLHALMSLSNPDDEELMMLQKTFSHFKKQITHHIEKEFQGVAPYPYELLYDLKSNLIRHVSDKYNSNLYYAVVFSIASLETDIIVHNRLKESVLIPLLKTQNKQIVDNIHYIIALDQQKEEQSERPLTPRETEILKLIVRGNLNKQIADELNISINTVLTHRKNILAKTGIKTTSGLTLYSISKGLLLPNEIQMK